MMDSVSGVAFTQGRLHRIGSAQVLVKNLKSIPRGLLKLFRMKRTKADVLDHRDGNNIVDNSPFLA